MSGPFVSFAQNGEDVVVWRALRSVTDGFYVDVGANDPTVDSVTRALYDRGWSGVTVEPVAAYAAAHRAERPRDTLFEVAATSRSGGSVTLHEIVDTGLSTLRDDIADRHAGSGWASTPVEVPALSLDDMLEQAGAAGREIHLVVIDVEGAEADVIAGFSLDRWRPWVLVVEATEPRIIEAAEPGPTVLSQDGWEPRLLAAGYEPLLFDGLSRFYVRRERAAELGPALSYPACVLDGFVTARAEAVRTELERVSQDASRWREVALDGWAAAVAELGARQAALDDRVAELVRELAAVRGSVSWRLTAPLRAVRERELAARRRGGA